MKKLTWVDNKRGKHVGVRITDGDGTSETYGLKLPGFLGMFGDRIAKRLSIDRKKRWAKKAAAKIKSNIWRR